MFIFSLFVKEIDTSASIASVITDSSSVLGVKRKEAKQTSGSCR